MYEVEKNCFEFCSSSYNAHILSIFSYHFNGENMKKVVIIGLMIILLIPFSVSAIETSARSAILMDTDSNRIMYAKNIDEVRSVASISKIMTGILACESGKLDDTIVIGDEILDAYGSAIYIKVGEKIKLRDLVYGLMLRSGNDAALAIAKYVGGDVDNFVKLMNEKAKKIGMKNTIFNNPSGLDENGGNLSTAYDMAILMSYAVKNVEFKTIVGTKKHSVKTNMNVYSWTNKNKLLGSYKYATGGKTGYTEIAKRTLVTTASKDNLNLVVVTLNDGNDFSDHKSLHEYGFNTYDSYNILQKGNINIYDDNYYKKGELYINNGYAYPLLDKEKEMIRLKFEIERKDDVQDGDKVGIVKIYFADKELYKDDVYFGEIKSSKKLGFFDSIWKWIKNLW